MTGERGDQLAAERIECPLAVRLLRATWRGTTTVDGALTRSATAEVCFDRGGAGDTPNKRETAAIRGGTDDSVVTTVSESSRS
jgi:hypothetical protein